MFSVRLINADSYQAQPLPQLDPTFSQFRGSEIKHVPIIRIFGTTSNGEKTCLHVHGVFPYFYVPYTGEEDPTSLAYRLSASLDAAINVSLGSATSNTQHVYLIQRVSGIPFYGYHRKEHQYLKIYFYNPAMIKRAADLLQNGSVLNQSLQPHEAHIPYILQFMMDYNVYGMSLVNLSSVKHRRLTQTLAELTASGQSATSENSDDIEYLPATIERQSTCEVEIDALASDIINRREIESGLDLNPGLAAIWEEERARRVQAGFQGGDSQLVNPKSPPRPTFCPTDNDIYQEQRLARRLSMISQCDESSLSTTSNQSIAYAAEVKEGENLLNSSNLLFSYPTTEKTQLGDREDPTLFENFLDSRTDAVSQQRTPDCSILGTDDAHLVDLLVQLAADDGENQDSIDLDSLLGSQISALQNGEKSDNEEEDDDVIDLNLTSVQLDRMNSLEIPAERVDEASRNDENNLNLTDLGSILLSYDSSNSSDEKKTTKRSQAIPQYDGAGDVSPTLLNSEDEDNDTHPKEFSHLPEYNGSCESASQSPKLDNLDHTLKLSSNDFVTTKKSENNSERRRTASPVDTALHSSVLPSIFIADKYMEHLHDSNYEPLDRLLAIGQDYVPDLEGLHSSMEIGVLFSCADSDSPESVDETPEDEAIPLETVLNGDPCFTESAELDKSDLTELQDQYVSLLGNSLLPDVHTNLKIDNDMSNSSNFSDSDYQTGEKRCEILLNSRSPRSSITSRASSFSSENVAPNIQEPEARSCTKGKFNVSYGLDRESWNCKDSTRISTDNSDYNCNVVATWAELQNLQFVDKEKVEGRLGRSKERIRRRTNKRSDEKAASQILGVLDSKKINPNTSTLPLVQQDANNYSLLPRKISTTSETRSPIKITTNKLVLPIGSDITILERRSNETFVDVVREKSPASPKVPDIAAEVEIEHQTSFSEMETTLRLDSSHEIVIGSENDTPDAEFLAPLTFNADEYKNATDIVDSDKSREDRLNELSEAQITKGYSYYSSERSEHDYKAGGLAHWHCQLSKGHKIVQDQVFTSDQVWVIEKRKRGRLPRRLCSGVCMRSDCSVPIVLLKKIDDKNHEKSINIAKSDSSVETKTLESHKINIGSSAAGTLAKKRFGPKSHSIGRKWGIRGNPIESTSSDYDEDISVATGERFAKKNTSNESINEQIHEPRSRNKEETRDSELSEAAEAETSSSTNECSKPGGNLAHNTSGLRRRYSRKKKSRVRSSKKMITVKSSRKTRNRLTRSVTHLAKHENSDLPGIPGVGYYQSTVKRGRPRKNEFIYFNDVSSENITPESPRKRSKIQRVLKSWASKREISSQRQNAIVNCVENNLSVDKNNAISPDRRTINSPRFDFASPIPKRNLSPRDNSKDVSFSINRASTPTKIPNEIHGLTEAKLSECVALNLMMREVKSRSTRAKLKILLEKRKPKATNNSTEKKTKVTAERTSLTSEKPQKNTEIETPVDLQNSELTPIFSTEDSTKTGEIDNSEEADNADDSLDQSFETVSDFSEVDQKTLEPRVDLDDVIVDNGIATNLTLNADICNNEASRLFEAELAVLDNRIPEANHIEQLYNERKEISYQNDQFMTTIDESNFFSGSNYTVDAVSLEIPACLFEEDSNSVDKRSPKKISGGGDNLKTSNDLQNCHDAYSDFSVDYRDLDVYDVESLTPSSSLATLNETALEGNETETQSVSTCLEKSGSELKSKDILDSSFKNASPEFLSPSPEMCDLIKPMEEEFAVYSTAAILETERNFDHSLTYVTDNSRTETQQEKVNSSMNDSDLDPEIQELVSQAVMQIENQNHWCETEKLVIEILEPVVGKNNKDIAVKSEIVIQSIGKPETPTKTEPKKQNNNLSVAIEEDEKSFETNEYINSASKKIIVKEIESFATETESQIDFQQTVIHKSELMDTRFESKYKNEEPKACFAEKTIVSDENYYVTATQNYIINGEKLDKVSKESSKCRPVSIKLVNIDLSRFQGFQPKNFEPRLTKSNFLAEQNDLLLPTGDIVEEDFKTAAVQESTIDDDKNTKFRETRITCDGSGLIDHIKSSEATRIESPTIIGNFAEAEEIEEIIPRQSSSPLTISDDSDIFETVMPIETRKSSQNCPEIKTKRMFKWSRLPARRSRRKCAEKTRQKLAQQTTLHFPSAESHPSAEESKIIRENNSFKAESRLHEKSENRLTSTNTISECALNTVFQSLKYASTHVTSSYLTEEEEEEKTQMEEIKAKESLTKKKSTESALECVLSMQKIPNENKSSYLTWIKKCRSENSSLRNSRDTSPEMDASIEETASVDENVKPKTRLRVYSRKSHRRRRRKRRPVSLQLKPASQRRSLQQQPNISLVSHTSVRHISSDKTDQDNNCSLQLRLASRNIAETNSEVKDSVSRVDKSEVERNTQSSQTPERRHRSAKILEVKPSIDALEKSTHDTTVKKTRKTKVVRKTIVKENNDATIFLKDDNSSNTLDGSELLASKIMEDESRISTNVEIKDVCETITESRSRQSAPKKNARHVGKTNSERFVSPPERIAISNPHISVGRKTRRRTDKISFSSADKSGLKILSSQQETTENTVGPTSEKCEKFSLLSHKIEKEDEAESISKKGKTRKFLESNVQQLSIEENAQSTREITSEIPKLKEKLSHKTENENIGPTILTRAEKSNLPNGNSAENITEEVSQQLELASPKIAEITDITVKITVKNDIKSQTSSSISPNSSSEQTIERLSVEKIFQRQIEQEMNVKLIKKRRPRKISASNSRKLSKPKDVDKKTPKDLEASQLSQNVEQYEDKSTNFKAETAGLSFSKSSPAKENAQFNEDEISELFSHKINEEVVKNENSASPSLQPISIDDENDEYSVPLKNKISQNVEEKTFTKSCCPSSRKDADVDSETFQNLRNFLPNNLKDYSESESTSVETTQECIKEVLENNISVTNSASESNEPIIFVEPTGRNRLRTKRPNTTLLSRSQSLLEKDDRDNVKDLQKPEILSQEVEDKISQCRNTRTRKDRSAKSSALNVKKLRAESTSASTNYEDFKKSIKTRATSRRKNRLQKTTDTTNLTMDSVEDNSEAAPENKSLNDMKSPPKITEKVKNLTPHLLRNKNGRFRKIMKKDYDQAHDIAVETLQERRSFQPRILEVPIETESRGANEKGHQHKISTTIIEATSQQSTSSSEEVSVKSSTEKFDEGHSELKNSVTTEKKSCSAKKSEIAETVIEKEQLTQVIASKLTGDVAKPKSSSRNMKRTRTEKSPEAKPDICMLSEEATQKIFDKTPLKSNLSRQEVANDILEPVRSQKRVRFDEDSIRVCNEQLRTSEPLEEKEIVQVSPENKKKYFSSLNRDSIPTKVEKSENNSKSKKICKTTRATIVNLSRDVFALKDQHQQQQMNNPTDLEGNNGVTAKFKCTISSSDNASLDLSSLQESSTSHRCSKSFRGIPERATKSKAQDQAIQLDWIQQTKEMQPNDLELRSTKKIPFFSNSEMPMRCRSKPILQNQEPSIILQRLSRDTLKNYGFEYSVKNKTFVKNLKKHRPDPDYQIPAYDGPADFSSSESDDDQQSADVTIAREEKRVCVYHSGKKADKTRRQSIVTPKKRKLDEAMDAQSPMNKYRAIATPGPSSKTTFDSPNKTSMLKSPGHGSRYYPPLQIIVTSPKVRKEMSEAQNEDVRVDNWDNSGANSASFTPRRKNQQRLHENLLRGRMSAVKSPKNARGDMRSTPVTMGCRRPGELDEIKSGKQGEQIVRNISTIVNECDGATGNDNFTSTLRDGKDVRKKLVFSIAKHERQTDQISNAGLDCESTNLRTSGEPIDGLCSSDKDAPKSFEHLENLTDHDTFTLDPQTKPTQSKSASVDENLALYEVTTDDEDSEDDDACNVTFTQYIDSQIEKNQVLNLDRSKIAQETKEIVSLRPKFNPPSSQRIIDTMETYGVPKYRNQEPFFSNEADVVKQKELAQKMLEVPGKGLKNLPPFISSVEGITGIARWRRMKINELQPALAKSKDIKTIRALVGDDLVSVTPLIKPPTQKDVQNWLRARNYLEKKKEKQEKKANKTEDTPQIEIQGKIEDEECESNYSDVSIIEASPEKIVIEKNSENMENCTLKMKLAKRELLKKGRLMSSESEKAKNLVKASGSGNKTSVTQNSSSTEIDPSLLSILGKLDLFKDQEASRHLGVSCGQIEFLSDSTRSNVANENLQNAKALTRYQYLTIMCLEVHVSTREDLLPDAQYDSISAIFYSVQNDVPPTSNIKPLEHGVIVLADEEKAKNKMHYSYASKIPWSVSFANDEEALLNALVTLITRTDPEILIGWELETLSWGYVFQRATLLGMNLSKRISRIPATQCKWETPASDIESLAEVKLPGRIVLDIWRIMRHEAALLSYTFESVMHHVLNERVPCPSFKTLTEWWNLKRVRPSRWRVIEHYSLRVLGVFRMLDQLDIIGRTSELARLFGIQFYEVFSRGSQYRVESVMLRLAKPLNYIAVSPTPLQRASMRAMEALPLILEPESKFYSDPLIVLDFQSLYPSIIIAHNYCFSTCLGRIEHIGQPQPYEFGAYTLRVPKSTALKLQGKMNYAPCGVAYVKPEVRLGILPRMLTEILETRFMVKKAMKDHKQADKTLQRALHSRQHGLKFLANVTYGYTAANFSGRMPCIEVGDSVISKSKETLERAIKLVEATPKWGARVVYGDTDSLFILVPGKSKAEAFVIGNEIADAVTASNLPPIKLKFEKVMYPAILQTKKRYCGYMYETPDQETPTYLAKGIETVRRDGCPAVSKILEKTLKILFETKDVSLVKKYVTRQLDKVLRGKVSFQDLTFAKEFRGLKGYKAKACVPALELTRRLMRKDPRAVPRNSERVRYIIVAGPPNQALIHCVRTPWELINDPGLRPNAIYYVTRVIIPPLNRCLNLMGVDVNAWYRDMPHRQILKNPVGQLVDKQKITIFQYFGTIVCVSCGEPSNKGICAECLKNPADTLVVLHEKLRWLNRTYDQTTAICQSCVGQTDIAECSSLDCPVFYRRAQAQRELSQATHLQSIIECGNALEF